MSKCVCGVCVCVNHSEVHTHAWPLHRYMLYGMFFHMHTGICIYVCMHMRICMWPCLASGNEFYFSQLLYELSLT